VRGARVVVLAGSGSNGGDALHAGALLARRGVAVVVVATSASPHVGGLAAARAVGVGLRTVVDGGPGQLLTVEEAASCALDADVLLDGLLGIGATGGGIRGVGGALVETLTRALTARDRRPVVVAVDAPSGVGVDDGTVPAAALPADLTVTFGAAKPGLLLPPADAYAGRVEVVDIGLRALGPRPAVARLEDEDVAALWPVPARTAHKYRRGVLGVVAGTAAYPGAAVLACEAAVLAGVGMVRFAPGAAAASAAVLAARPEVVVGPGRVQAWVLGPGVDPGDEVRRLAVVEALERASADQSPAVVDAGALDLLPERVGPTVVLTPHAGELARLLTARGTAVDREAVEAEPWRHARLGHELTGATVLLKGATTVVVGAEDAVYSQADAPAWLATAGAGDVLAGLLGALLTGRADDVREDPTLTAALAAAAALVHGRAAARANPGGPVSALAVARAIPGTVAALLAGGAVAR
jgi:hydroxyethylthiazole kinase-like uncharacterized protein yjeF